MKNKGYQPITDISETLGMIALSHDCGEVEKIISANAIGIEWEDSRGDFWFMQWPSIETLLNGWNEVGMVNCFFDGNLKSGEEKRCIVRVFPTKMREIKQFHAKIKGAIDDN